MKRRWWKVPAVVLLASCTGQTEQEQPGAEAPAEPVVEKVADGPNVVVITLDTTRADRIGAYGYEKAITPTIDALAATGRRYARAYSPLPLTIPSHASLFTGRTPGEVGVRDNGQGLVRDSELLLAEVLNNEGYTTGASIAAFVTTRYWGFSQGFDIYFDEIDDSEDFWHASRSAEEVIDDALLWKDRQPEGKPQFLWVHLYDAHSPYEPHEEFMDKEDPRPYDSEIAYVDSQVKRLVEAYEGQETLFVVVGDHGEGLNDHNELRHGLMIFDGTQHVPFIMNGPGIEPAVVDEPVTLRDVMPTVLDQLDIAVPETVSGHVVPSETPRPVCLEAWQLRSRFGIAPQLGVVEGEYKLIDIPQPELYNVVADPAEEKNLAEAEPARVEEMRKLVETCGFQPPEAEGETGTLDAELVAKLEALGYAQGGFAGDLEGDLPDYKDHKDLLRKMQKLQFLGQKGKEDEIVALLESLLEPYPEVTEIRTRLASSYGAMGRHDEAIAMAREALAIRPDHPPLMQTLGSVLAQTGKFEEAAEMLLKAADAMPYSPRARTVAVAALLAANREDPSIAVGVGLEYLDQFPEDYSLAGLLGVALAHRGDMENAERLLRLGVREEDAPARDAHLELARMAILAKKLDDAQMLLERELKFYPESRFSQRLLMDVYGQKQDWENMARVSKDLLDGGAVDGNTYYARIQALFNLGEYEACRAEIDRAVKLHPSSSRILLLDANVMAKEGRTEEGKVRFEEAKKAKLAEKVEFDRRLAENKERRAQGLPPLPLFPGQLPAEEELKALAAMEAMEPRKKTPPTEEEAGGE